MNILGVIPARGGSKGIPKKNIKLLAGRPLIAWTIDAARASRHITRFIVSTDSQEIADVAREFGADVPFLRPADISGDRATDVQFLQHAIDFLKKEEGYAPDIVLRLPPTSPLRTAQHIDEGIEKLFAMPEADSVRPITEASKHPYKMWRITEDGKFLAPLLSKEFTGFDEPQNLPRQLFPKVYVHTGAMDVMRRMTITEQKSTSGKHVGYFFMDPVDSINIDHLVDFEIAEFFMKKRFKMRALWP